MKRAALLLLPLLAACGGGEDDQPARREARPPAQLADLTGLYELGGESGTRGQMCMIRDPSGTVAFAISTETGAGSCSGAGEAVREGSNVRLAMAGDEQCPINAQIAGSTITFPSAVPQGCAYYCARGASLAGHEFEKTGGTAEDAMRATDLAGDPLCG